MISFADAPGADRSEDADLADLVEQLTDRLQAGDAVDLEEVARCHPEYAERLRELLPALHALAGAAVPPARSAPASVGSAPAAPCGVLGDYRLIREVGRGGMGVVYEAEQISLNRRVALKVLPLAAALDARPLKRFKAEAQAAAQLHHPHIAPVYAVGSERGVHYYAMQFIDGQTLADVVAEFRRLAGMGPAGVDSSHVLASQVRAGQSDPDRTLWQLDRIFPPERPPSRPGASSTARGSLEARTTVHSHRDRAFCRTVAAWGVQAAGALDYAHQLGVVHRDIKPANLMIDADGKLWVTDFGLARFVHDGGVTVTGELLGTVRYMSPEQASARRGVVDHRSDIYALGVTLYEMLTLEPAVTGRDQRELLAQVVGDEIQPPRRLNRSIPVELETVILKAVAKDPADRYATAEDLADDLTRFLEDRPVKARRPTPAERLTRWCRRHQKLVLSTAAVMAGVLVMLATFTVIVLRKVDEADHRTAQTRRAMAAITEIATKWHWLTPEPHLEPLQRQMLQEAREFYEELARDTAGDRDRQFEAAKAQRLVADVQQALAEHDRAGESYAAALERLGRLAADAPNWPDARGEWAVALVHRGNLHRTRGRLGAAEEDYSQARGVLVQLAAYRSAAPVHRAGLAGCDINLGVVRHALGRHADAERSFRHAAAALSRLIEHDPEAPTLRHDLATCENNLGTLFRDTGRLTEAEREFDRAVSRWRPLVGAFPALPAYRQALATGLFNLGLTRAALGRPAAAAEAYREAQTGQERLAAESPRAAAYREELAATHHELGLLHGAEGRYADADQALRQAAALRGQLAEAHPGVPGYRRDLAASQHGRGSLLAAGGRWTAAEEALRAALAVRERLAAEAQAVPHYRLELAQTRHTLAWVLAARGQVGAAEAFYRQAVAGLEDRAGVAADAVAWEAALATVELDLGRLLRNAGRAADAEPLARKACDRAGRLAAAHPDGPADRDLLAAAAAVHGAVCADLGRTAEAEEAFDRAVAVRKKLTVDFPAVPRYQAELAWLLATCPIEGLRDPAAAVAAAQAAVQASPHDGSHWTRLGAALLRAGDGAAAVKALVGAVERRGGGDRTDWVLLALAHGRRGNATEARQWYTKATAQLSGAAPDADWERLRAEAAAALGP